MQGDDPQSGHLFSSTRISVLALARPQYTPEPLRTARLSHAELLPITSTAASTSSQRSQVFLFLNIRLRPTRVSEPVLSITTQLVVRSSF